jgi:hypothetical protein
MANDEEKKDDDDENEDDDNDAEDNDDEFNAKLKNIIKDKNGQLEDQDLKCCFFLFLNL